MKRMKRMKRMMLLLLLGVLGMWGCGDRAREGNGEQASGAGLEIDLKAAVVPEDESGEVEEEAYSVYRTMEEAYYAKYFELAEEYGTPILYETANGKYSESSYLGGVAAAGLMDFNGDGMKDLFITYADGELETNRKEGSDLEIYKFPRVDNYKVEVWTYREHRLELLLREEKVSVCYDTFNRNYFITLYENSKGLPVIQVYDELLTDEQPGRGCEYRNVYFEEDEAVRDILRYCEGKFLKNGLEITEDIWSEEVAGYDKILLCALLADSRQPERDLEESYGIAYQLQPVYELARLLKEGEDLGTPAYPVAEREYIRAYLQDLERNNRIRFESDFAEDHHYNLYDMNRDGMPELIYYESTSGAGTHFHFKTLAGDSAGECGEYGRTNLYVNGEGGMIAYFGRMDEYWIDKIELYPDNILITEIDSGNTRDENGVPGDYPELEDYGYENYEYLPFCYPAIPLALYFYEAEISNR